MLGNDLLTALFKKGGIMTYNDKFLVEQWEAEAREKDRKEAVRWFFVLFICLLMMNRC